MSAEHAETVAKILVVEDEPALARAICRLVKLHGRTVESAGSCSAARRLDQDFDCGIFDVELPDGSGVDLAAELLQEKRVQRVVFFTATGEESLCERASRLGEVFRKHDGIGQLERVIFDCQHVSANGG